MKKFTFLVFVVLVSMIANAQTWTQQNTNMAGTVVGVDQISVVDSNIVWINGFNGSGTAQKIKVHSRTQNGGTTWEPGTYNGFGATVYPYVLTGVTYDKAFAIAMDTASSVASFWKTTNGGASWSLVPNVLNNGTTTFANAVLFWDSSKGFCMGDPVAGKFDIYYTTDGGDTWTPTLAANVSVPLSGEYGYNGFECATKFEGGYAAFITNKGRVYKTSNYGVNWTVTKTAPFTSASTGKIYLTGPNKMIVAAVETGGTAYVWKQTNDNGATWTNYTPSGNFYTYALAYVPKSNNMLVSTSPFSTAKGVSYSNDGGATWTDFIDPLLCHREIIKHIFMSSKSPSKPDEHAILAKCVHIHTLLLREYLKKGELTAAKQARIAIDEMGGTQSGTADWLYRLISYLPFNVVSHLVGAKRRIAGC
jgi:hypothetical protein